MEFAVLSKIWPCKLLYFVFIPVVWSYVFPTNISMDLTLFVLNYSTRYANVDFVGVTSPGNFCRRQAATSIENGLSCYQGLGMTQDCARIWSDTSWNTASNCFGSCVLNPTLPIFGGDGFSSSNYIDDANTSDISSSKWYDLPITLKERLFSSTDTNETTPASIPGNGPAPECVLNDCLVCNEETSAPTFDKFAGRNRKNSGLLSTVAFACGSIPNIVHDPCPITKPLE